ncbi:hypothetical protein [Mesorhizobium sp. WSM2240]|jgi:hypothetical protein
MAIGLKGVNMWIRLTRADGNPITVNTDYLVSIQDHGDRTLIVHTCGELLVLESQLALFEALRLQPIDRDGPKRDRRAELH